jgi:MoaA/NifB/PqqE/SkfB family radical SAM enzyme
LRWDRLERIVEELLAGGLRSFRLAGGGEPTLYPDFDRLCATMGNGGVVLENLTTNGIRLDERHIAAVTPLGPTNFHVSLNYATREQYERFMRIPADRFDAILENIRLLDEAMQLAGTRAQNQIHLQFFVHRSTVGDIGRAMDIATELPVDTITLRSVGGCPGHEKLNADDRENLARILPAVAERSRGKVWLMFDMGMDGLQNLCQSITSSLYASHLASQPPRPAEIEFCYIGWYSMTIQGTGEVHPCCYLMPDPGIPAFGNLAAQGAQEVWQGAQFRKFREEMRHVMVRDGHVSPGSRPFRCTRPMCWTRNECPMAHNLADTEFYIGAHKVLRHRPEAWFHRAVRRLRMLGG